MNRGIGSNRSTENSARTNGIALMTVAMLILPAVDGLAKYLATVQGYSPLFVGWGRYVAASLVVLPIAAARHRGNVFPGEQLGSHLLRTAVLVTGMTLYFLAIARIPLVTVASTYFVGPVLAVLLSLVVLKERLTPVKVVSLVLAFAGSLIILQPGSMTIDPGLLMALGAGISFGIYIVATRRAATGSDPIKTLTFQCVVGALLLTPQAIWFWTTPAWSDVGLFVAMGVVSAASHMMSIAAFRLAEASTLSPLVYIELIGAALIGYVAFSEVPAVTTLLGAAFIVTAGLVLLRGSRMRSAVDTVG